MERNAKGWKLELNKAICAVDQINNLTPRPQFVVICGDFVNEMPNSKLNHITFYFYKIYIYIPDDTEIYQLQVNDFMKIFSNLHPSISLVCVCGNHDVGNIPDEKSIDK